MINVEFIGEFGSIRDSKREIKDLILREAPEVAEASGRITVHPSPAEDFAGRSRPYIRVASTNAEDGARIAKLIHDKLGWYVEWFHLDGFIEEKH